MKLLLICLFLLYFISPVSGYVIDGNTVYIDDVNVHLSATPHTLASSGWVYFNLTSKQYTGDLDVVWGFNTSISKPTRGELYAPHWVNTTTDHELFLYNVTQLQVYYGDNLDYGNSYNSFQYSGTYQVQTYNETTMEPDGYETITSNVSFDSSVQDGDNYTIYWHTRHDKWTLWKDKTSTFQSVTYDYEGYDKWYYIKDVDVTAGTEYTMRAWVEVPVSLTPQSGKYYFAVKPSGETIAQAVANGHFYALDPWWNSSWTYYKTITLNQTMIDSTIGDVHYTLLVDLASDSDLADHAQADGDDIVFVDSTNTTQLAHTLSTFNSTTGAIVVYVNVTDPSNVTSINMYYNNSGATNTEDKSGTWGTGAMGIWLFDEGTGTNAEDSSGNDNNGTASGSIVWTADGVNFNDTGMFNCGDIGHTDVITVIIRAKQPTGSTGSSYMIQKTVGSYEWDLLWGANGYSYFLIGGTNSGGQYIAPGENWHTYLGRYDQQNIELWIDGVLRRSTAKTTPIPTTTQSVGIGTRVGSTGYWDGSASYACVYNYAFSDEEIAVQYNNTNSPSLFISVGAEQSDAAGNAPNITSWQNNKTSSNTLDFTINTSESVNFNATANQTITTWHWYKDSVNQSHNYNNITLDWTSTGLKHVVVNATNANGTSSSITWNVTVEGTTPNFSYYKVITINQTMVNQSIGDGHYTMLVEITDTDLANHSQSDGDDIVFYDSDNTTQLPHQIEGEYNSTTGYLKAHVGFSDISNISTIVMYYGNATVGNSENKSGTWGVNASGIWLMDEGTGSYVNDSSGNDNNGTITGADWNVSGGLDFIAVNSDYITCGQVVSGYPFTMTVRVFSNSSALGMFVSVAGDEPYYHAIAYDGSTDYVYVRSYDLNSFNFVTTMDINDGFHTITGVWKNASSRVLYIDGIYKGISTATETGIEYTSTKIGVTADSTPIGYQNGTIAYTHIYNSALSNESISTTYNNTEYPTLFISIGDEQSEAADTTDPTYSNVAHNTTIAGAAVKFSIQYNDDTALHTNGQYIFATNNTGVWVNETAVNWTATPEYANVTKTLNSTVGVVVGYRWYANDTAGNSNNTGIYTLTVTSVSDSSFTVSLPAGQTAINFTATTCKDTLLEPGGQTAGVPIINVTNTGNVVQSFRFYLNTTVSNVLTYTSLSSDLSNPVELNTTTTTVIITNLPASNSDNVWMYCNLSTPSPGTTGKLLTVNSS